MTEIGRAAAVGVAIMIVLGGVAWGLNRTALDYGPAENSYLEPAVVRTGDTVQACFGSIIWYRPMPGRVTQWFECKKRGQDGNLVDARFDMQDRTIRYPKEPGKLPPKCRPIGNDSDIPYPVPGWCEPGQLRYNGFARIQVGASIKSGGLWELQYSLPSRMVAEIRP